jgi:energy-coupling factor transport system ATP-binding protein
LAVHGCDLIDWEEIVSLVVEIKDYTWKYINADGPSLKGINLTIEEGTFVGIIGANGAGKTTLAYSMDGLIPGQYHGIKHGEVRILGRDVEEYQKGELQRQVGVVFSDPEAQFTAMTVEDELVFGMENLGMSLSEIRDRLEWVTELTDLRHLLLKPPYEISGGQKQRVALASVLAMMPKIMILDEPTAMLDPVSRKRVFQVLERLKREQHNTIIAIEHSLENLIPLADRMVLLSDGELLLEDETSAFFQNMDLLREKGIYPPGGLSFYHRLAQAGFYGDKLPITLDEAVERLPEVLAAARSVRSAS